MLLEMLSLMLPSPWGFSKLWEFSDKQYIANTECTAGSSLLPEQQPYAMLGMPQIFPSSWALGMGKRRHLSGYSQGLSSSSQF